MEVVVWQGRCVLKEERRSKRGITSGARMRRFERFRKVTGRAAIHSDIVHLLAMAMTVPVMVSIVNLIMTRD